MMICGSLFTPTPALVLAATSTRYWTPAWRPPTTTERMAASTVLFTWKRVSFPKHQIWEREREREGEDREREREKRRERERREKRKWVMWVREWVSAECVVREWVSGVAWVVRECVRGAWVLWVSELSAWEPRERVLRECVVLECVSGVRACVRACAAWWCVRERARERARRAERRSAREREENSKIVCKKYFLMFGPH